MRAPFRLRSLVAVLSLLLPGRVDAAGGAYDPLVVAPDLVVALLPVIEALDRLGVRYYVGGSVASSIHGVPRASIDADDLEASGRARLEALGESPDAAKAMVGSPEDTLLPCYVCNRLAAFSHELPFLLDELREFRMSCGAQFTAAGRAACRGSPPAGDWPARSARSSAGPCRARAAGRPSPSSGPVYN